MRKINIIITIILVFLLAISVWAQNKNHEKIFSEGIFQFKLPSNFYRVTGQKLEEMKRQTIQGARELAEKSKLDNPKAFNQSSLSFFSAYQTQNEELKIIFMGNQAVMNYDEMYEYNVRKIKWGINSGELSKNSKGVSKLIIDNTPCLLMDMEFPDETRLLSYYFFSPKYSDHIFLIGLTVEKGQFGKNDYIIKSFVNSIKIALQDITLGEPASPKTSEIINDAATLKIISFDLYHNLVGLEWKDRERWGVGKEIVRKKGLKIAVKYKMNTKKLGTILDYDIREIGGGVDSSGYFASVTIPDSWSYIYRFDEYGNLPIVKFKSGQITLFYETMAVSFKDKTECMINNKEYIYNEGEGKWFEK